ncbi:MAG: hypothetical protein LKE64_00840 [Solobacterium sp.]|jgi:hypothetical protein|nr:hypothetical protein [Solobacterium sp.]MCH4050014.1 hypothetical protein [Solobacterium sp.]MCH4073699.1 hypothetical protein [Solobacterium sp.]MCI1313188.1 hypothetical protein [Solobacterium sp.]MCI1347169.1 hypothetical protein [Solobacterium sp.]
MEQYERNEITWPQLKQKYYGRDVIVKYGSDYIDFSRSTMDLDDYDDPEKAYSRMLDIQADPDCILYPGVETIFYRNDLPDQVIVDGLVQGFDHEFRMIIISPAHFLYYRRPLDEASIEYACTEYGFAIPLEEFDHARKTDIRDFEKGDHITLFGNLVRTIVSDETGPTFIAFAVDRIVFAMRSADPVPSENSLRAKGMVCFFCTHAEECDKKDVCVLKKEDNDRLEAEITAVLDSTPCPLTESMNELNDNIQKAVDSLVDRLPERKDDRLLS